MKQVITKKWQLGFVLVALCMTGCPSPPTFEVWLVNASGLYTATNVYLMDGSGKQMDLELVTDEGVAGQTLRIFAPIPVSSFEGDTELSVGISLSDGSMEMFGADVVIPGAITGGAVYPLVANGETEMGFSFEHVEVEAAAKARLAQPSEE